MQRIELLDTTLRDGAQGEGVEHSLSDKRKIALALDRLGVPLIEGGNPTGNPKDQTFFEEARKAPFLTQAVLVPFGSTCHAGAAPEEDAGLAALLGTEQPVVSLFGKADIRQVTEVLRVTPQENLRMIRESVAYLAGQGRRVLFDAEHFFDGAQYDRDYAMEALRAARTCWFCAIPRAARCRTRCAPARRRCFARWGTRAWASIAMTIWGWPWRVAWHA